MIKLYYHPSPNPAKIALFLEEAGLPYEMVPVDTRKGEQFKPEFLAINPNAKTPALTDGDVTVFDSNAILLYLAEKSGQLMPGELAARYRVIQWVMWQMGGLGPMAGQNGHFLLYANEKIPYAIERYGSEVRRLYNVLDKALAGSEYVAGDYSIADIACFPWIMTHKAQGLTLDDYPNVKRWFAVVRARPAVQAGLAVGADLKQNKTMDEETRRHLFGKQAGTPAS